MTLIQRNKTDQMYYANRIITEKYNHESLSNKRAFILAGGPSLSQFDFTPLAKEFTIGINRSFERYPVSINYMMDHEFYEMVTGPEKQLDNYGNDDIYNKFMCFKGDKVALAIKEPSIRYSHDVFVVNRIYDEEKRLNTTNLNEGIHAGTNSGYGAISLAISLGCRELYLLGYDMEAREKTHYHNGYQGQKIEDYRTRIEIWKEELRVLSEEIKGTDISITNCIVHGTEDTTLSCFPIKKITEIGV